MIAAPLLADEATTPAVQTSTTAITPPVVSTSTPPVPCRLNTDTRPQRARLFAGRDAENSPIVSQ